MLANQITGFFGMSLLTMPFRKTNENKLTTCAIIFNESSFKMFERI